MGEIVPPLPPGDYERGIRCPDCEEEYGGPWPNNSTPRCFYVYFTGMVGCPQPGPPYPDWPAPPNGREFRLNQVPGIPCEWRYFTPGCPPGPGWHVIYMAYSFPGEHPYLDLSAWHPDDWLPYFISTGDWPYPPCVKTFSNSFTTCWQTGAAAKYGTAFVHTFSINDLHAYKLAIEMALMPSVKCSPTGGYQISEGKYEPDRKLGEATRCMTLAHWFDHTNCLIKYHPSELPP